MNNFPYALHEIPSFPARPVKSHTPRADPKASLSVPHNAVAVGETVSPYGRHPAIGPGLKPFRLSETLTGSVIVYFLTPWMLDFPTNRGVGL
jgi:hypothetical protein